VPASATGRPAEEYASVLDGFGVDQGSREMHLLLTPLRQPLKAVSGESPFRHDGDRMPDSVALDDHWRQRVSVG